MSDIDDEGEGQCVFCGAVGDTAEGLCRDCAELARAHGLRSWSDYFDWLNRGCEDE